MPADKRSKAYGLIVDKLLEQNCIEDAQKFVAQLSFRDPQMTPCFRQIVQKYLELKLPDEAFRVAQKIADIKEKTCCISLVILFYTQSNSFKEALDCLRALPENGSNECCVLPIVDGYCRNGHVEAAINLLGHLPASDAVNFRRFEIAEILLTEGKLVAAKRQVGLIAPENKKVEAIFDLAALMASKGLGYEVDTLINMLPRDLDLGSFVFKIDKIASLLIRLGRIQVAAKLIKLMYPVIPKEGNAWNELRKKIMASGVVAAIRHLIKNESLIDAEMLVAQISMEYIQDELCSEISVARSDAIFK